MPWAIIGNDMARNDDIMCISASFLFYLFVDDTQKLQRFNCQKSARSYKNSNLMLISNILAELISLASLVN